MSKQFLNFLCPNSFKSALPNWDVEANTLSDWWLTTFRSIWHPHSLSRVLRNHLLTLDSKSVILLNFFKCMVYILHDFCVEIVRWGSFFRSINLREFFKLVEYPACFITIQSILKMIITSVFSIVRREWPKTMGSETTWFLRRMWYRFYTILLHIFLLIWCLSLNECCRLNSENEDKFHV